MKDKIFHARKALNTSTAKAKIALICLEQYGEPLSNYTHALRCLNDVVIPEFVNSGRYTKSGNLTTAKHGLAPNACVQQSKKLLAKRTSLFKDKLVSWNWKSVHIDLFISFLKMTDNA